MPEIKPSQWDEESGEKEEDGEKASQSIATKEKKVESQARVTKAKRPKAQAEGLRDTLTCKQSWRKAQWASRGWARAGQGLGMGNPMSIIQISLLSCLACS